MLVRAEIAVLCTLSRNSECGNVPMSVVYYPSELATNLRLMQLVAKACRLCAWIEVGRRELENDVEMLLGMIGSNSAAYVTPWYAMPWVVQGTRPITCWLFVYLLRLQHVHQII